MKKENKEWLPFRIGGGIILGIALAMMFIIKPSAESMGHPIDTNTLWEAVHPFHPVWDTIALAGLLFFSAYIFGFAGSVVYSFAEKKRINIHVIAIVSMLLTLLFLA